MSLVARRRRRRLAARREHQLRRRAWSEGFERARARTRAVPCMPCAAPLAKCAESYLLHHKSADDISFRTESPSTQLCTWAPLACE